MKVLLLGVGMQGTVALDDLVRSPEVTEVIAADLQIDRLRSHVTRMKYGDRVRCEPLDAGRIESVDRLFAEGPDVAIDLLPTDFIPTVAAFAVKHRVHLVNTFFVPDELRALDEAAKERGVAILPEFGMDPGIDLVLLGETARGMDEVLEIHSYGGGIPAPEASGNAIRYKISWTFEGVLRAYRRPGRIKRAGREVVIPADRLFDPEYVHTVEIEGLGDLEAYVTGDAIEYCEVLGTDLSVLRATGRYSLRWPGHCAFWKKLVDLHLLDEEPVMVDGHPVDRIDYLVAALEPHLQYEESEQDLAILRLVVTGRRDGAERTVTHEVVDRRDPVTGFSAMGRLVGFTASVGARMLGLGEIEATGLLSPLHDVPGERFVSELRSRGVSITTMQT